MPEAHDGPGAWKIALEILSYVETHPQSIHLLTTVRRRLAEAGGTRPCCRLPLCSSPRS